MLLRGKFTMAGMTSNLHCNWYCSKQQTDQVRKGSQISAEKWKTEKWSRPLFLGREQSRNREIGKVSGKIVISSIGQISLQFGLRYLFFSLQKRYCFVFLRECHSD